MLITQFILEDQLQAQTLSPSGSPWTVKGYVRALEANTADNVRSVLVIRVYRPSTGTFVGTLFDSGQPANESEWPITTAASRKFPVPSNAGTCSQVVCQTGDLLVYELGCRCSADRASQATLRFGDSGVAGDLAENETATSDANPWVELSGTVVFATFVDPSSASVTVTAGSPTVELVTSPSSASATASPGSPAAEFRVDVQGAAVTAQAGSPSAELVASPGSASVTVAAGAPSTDLDVAPESAEAVVVPGTPLVELVGSTDPLELLLYGAEVSVEAGSPTVEVVPIIVEGGVAPGYFVRKKRVQEIALVVQPSSALAYAVTGFPTAELVPVFVQSQPVPQAQDDDKMLVELVALQVI